MKYKEALKILKQYNKEYAKENESKEDIIYWIKQVKEEVHPIAFKPDENYTHCDTTLIVLFAIHLLEIGQF